jgi:hypothetical protein
MAARTLGCLPHFLLVDIFRQPPKAAVPLDDLPARQTSGWCAGFDGQTPKVFPERPAEYVLARRSKNVSLSAHVVTAQLRSLQRSRRRSLPTVGLVNVPSNQQVAVIGIGRPAHSFMQRMAAVSLS